MLHRQSSVGFASFTLLFHILVPCDEGDIRLIESSNRFQIGLIEICVNGIWGTICRDSWGNVEASIACKQLGYSPYGTFINNINVS